MGIGEVPVVLARGLYALLRDAHRHALFGVAMFLPLWGADYVMARPFFGAYALSL